MQNYSLGSLIQKRHNGIFVGSIANGEIMVPPFNIESNRAWNKRCQCVRITGNVIFCADGNVHGNFDPLYFCTRHALSRSTHTGGQRTSIAARPIRKGTKHPWD
jgi:hypothetical protein